MGSSWVKFCTQTYGSQATFQTQKYGTNTPVYECYKDPLGEKQGIDMSAPGRYLFEH